ncbi:class I SAM-dependent RNA methyltransferase, partial [Nostocoides japonicum]|uniref:class I SAM-dependent RNA methyltransferase n=1 Tax=Nostocoides japonicum TaxID=99481 RepID=UPI00069D6698
MTVVPAESLVGRELTVDVGAVAHGGHFVARHEGRVVFVRHALPGERVVARVTEGAPGDRFLRADAISVLVASPDRVVPPCRYAGPGRCGGCDFQHVTLAAQRRLKAAVVREQLERLGHLSEAELSAAGMPAEAERLPGPAAVGEGLGWRTRVELTASPRGRMGLRRHRSHEVVELDRCLIAAPGVEATGVLRHTWDAGVTGVDVVDPSIGVPVAVPVPEPGTPPVVRERVVLASGWESTFSMSARGFWQVHPAAAATLVSAVLEALSPREGERVVDLYAGVGLFAAALADAVGSGGQVVAVESDPVAVPHTVANLAARRQALVVAARVEDALGVPRRAAA